MGAAVRPGGRASGALRRRVEVALAAAGDRPDARFLATGGVGRHPPAEAAVMRELLVAAGVAADRIVLDEQATDTLASVVSCTRILRAAGADRHITVCSHDFHLPRCRLLFRALGLRVAGAPVAGSRRALGSRAWLVAVARELVGHALRPGARARAARLGPDALGARCERAVRPSLG